MATEPIALHEPWFDEMEEAALLRSFRRRELAGNGPACQELEGALRGVLGTRHCLTLSSATAALEIAMNALDVAGGEVIVPSFTFPSVGNAIVRAGGRPVFCEVREPDLNVDVEHARALVTSDTRAVVVTHYAGHPCRFETPPAPVVEDAAHALGSSLDGTPCGALGTVGCLSFHQTKNVVVGEGGALATDSTDIARTAEIFREKGTNRDAMLRGDVSFYSWVGLGSSLVMPELSAAIGTVQIGKLDAITAARSAVAARYDERLQPLEEREALRRVVPREGVSCHHIYAVLVEPERRPHVLTALRQAGVGAASHFVPLHSAPMGSRLSDTPPLPVTDRVAASLIRLPIYPGLSEDSVDRVCATLDSALATR